MEKYLNQLLQSTEQKPKAVKASVNVTRASLFLVNLRAPLLYEQPQNTAAILRSPTGSAVIAFLLTV